MKGAIPIQQVGDLHLRIADLVEVLRKPAVLAEFEDWQLLQTGDAVTKEIERRKKKAVA
jgi:hypothetical protein